jgi:DNA-binding transcriptional LysR family regulator
MNIDGIEVFLTVLQTKSISKAAEKLFLSQPTVSHRLKALESDLKTHLILRQKGSRNIELTYQGEQFIPIAEQWMSLYTDTQDIQNMSPHINLSIGCPDTLMTYFLPPLFMRLLNMETTMQLKILAYHSDELYKALDERKIDVGLGFYQMHYRNILSYPVFQEPFFLARRKRGTPRDVEIHPSKLDRKNEIYFYWCPEYQQWHDQWWDPAEKPHVEIDTASLIHHLMDKDELWMIGPRCILDSLKNDERLEVCRLAESPPERTCYLFTHRYPKPHHSKSMGIFRDKLAEYCAEQSWKID